MALSAAGCQVWGDPGGIVADGFANNPNPTPAMLFDPGFRLRHRAAFRVFLTGFIGLFILVSARAWTSYELHGMMGVGINYGEYFEKRSDRHRTDLDPIPLAHFQTIRNAGFGHVRLPITWGYRLNEFPSNTSQPVTINAQFLDAVRISVERALSTGLVVVIGTHHEDWFPYYWAAHNNAYIRLNRTGFDQNGHHFSYNLLAPSQGGRPTMEIYSQMYRQIVETFGAPQYNRVVFEGLNEPPYWVRDKNNWGTGSHWNYEGSPHRIMAFHPSNGGHALVNTYNQTIFSLIQTHSPQPQHRTFMLTVNDMNNSKSFRHLTMPAHGNLTPAQRRARLMITLHYYHAMPWTHDATPHQNTWGTFSDYDQLLERMDEIDSTDPGNFNQGNSPLVDVPVNIGEFGVAHRQRLTRNTDDVLEWYRAVTAAALERGYTATVWDDNGWFRVFNRGAGNFNHPSLPAYVSEIWKQVTLFTNVWEFESKTGSTRRLGVVSGSDWAAWQLQSQSGTGHQRFTFEIDPYNRLNARDRIKYYALRNAFGKYIDIEHNTTANGNAVRNATLPLDNVMDHYIYPAFHIADEAFSLVTLLSGAQYPQTTVGDKVVSIRLPCNVGDVAEIQDHATTHTNKQRWLLRLAP